MEKTIEQIAAERDSEDEIARMAQIALTICRVNMTEAQRNNAKDFGDCHDCFDANLALYGAYCGEFFAEPNAGLQGDADTLNSVAAMVDSMIKEGALK